MAFYKETLKKVRGFAFDVDGVLARSEILLHPDGDLMRSMNTKDGYAIQFAVKAGFPVAIVSGAKSPSIIHRFRNIGVQDIYLDVHDKAEVFAAFLSRYNLNAEEVLYMGDDMPDLPVLRMVEVSACPSDAAPDVQSVCMYISPFTGGTGCVRDVIEQVMRAQGLWPV